MDSYLEDEGWSQYIVIDNDIENIRMKMRMAREVKQSYTQFLFFLWVVVTISILYWKFVLY